MSCVYDAEPVSFTCILSVVSDIKDAKVTVETARKVIKQIDAGLAQFGAPKPVGVASLSDDEMLSRIEELCSTSGIKDVLIEKAIEELLVLLPKLLETILKKYL